MKFGRARWLAREAQPKPAVAQPPVVSRLLVSRGVVRRHKEVCIVPLRQFERSRFFTGQVLTADDLQREQDYHRDKARLHNRFLHGWGVVAGLMVSIDQGVSCRTWPCARLCGQRTYPTHRGARLAIRLDRPSVRHHSVRRAANREDPITKR